MCSVLRRNRNYIINETNMSKIILYGMTLSPPCRAIQLVAKALNIELEFVEVDLSKREHLTPEFLKVVIFVIN